MAQYRQTCSSAASEPHVSLGIRFPHKQNLRTHRRSGRGSDNTRKISLILLALILSAVLLVTVFACYYYISTKDNNKEPNRFDDQDDDLRNDSDFLTNVTRIKNKVLRFGHGSVSHGRDSRYWDRDDRRRDDEYNENVSDLANRDDVDSVSTDKDRVKERTGNKQQHLKQSEDHRTVGLYNEAGRDELKHYEAEYEASLKNVGQVNNNQHNVISDGENLELQNEGADFDDEYDDGIDSSDGRLTENDIQANAAEGEDDENEESSDTKDPNSHREVEEDTSHSDDTGKIYSRRVSGKAARRSTSEKRTNSRKPKLKRRRS